ncbi:ADNP homeobox protein 2 [Heterocephalus glaber]|uniref:ADNP homeobox protein 2 n=1 Tax=Heterocephalus glaber TaxID=10181 RepID=G5ARQ5_HETGA|nr:ADNP homeobox protein 2 [Heterocephalus glaber]
MFQIPVENLVNIRKVRNRVMFQIPVENLVNIRKVRNRVMFQIPVENLVNIRERCDRVMFQIPVENLVNIRKVRNRVKCILMNVGLDNYAFASQPKVVGKHFKMFYAPFGKVQNYTVTILGETKSSRSDVVSFIYLKCNFSNTLYYRVKKHVLVAHFHYLISSYFRLRTEETEKQLKGTDVLPVDKVPTSDRYYCKKCNANASSQDALMYRILTADIHRDLENKFRSVISEHIKRIGLLQQMHIASPAARLVVPPVILRVLSANQVPSGLLSPNQTIPSGVVPVNQGVSFGVLQPSQTIASGVLPVGPPVRPGVLHLSHSVSTSILPVLVSAAQSVFVQATSPVVDTNQGLLEHSRAKHLGKKRLPMDYSNRGFQLDLDANGNLLFPHLDFVTISPREKLGEHEVYLAILAGIHSKSLVPVYIKVRPKPEHVSNNPSRQKLTCPFCFGTFVTADASELHLKERHHVMLTVHTILRSPAFKCIHYYGVYTGNMTLAAIAVHLLHCRSAPKDSSSDMQVQPGFIESSDLVLVNGEVIFDSTIFYKEKDAK